jgi:threonine synthase
MTVYACLECGEKVSSTAGHSCVACGGMIGLPNGITFDREKISEGAPGIWRYKDSFGLPHQAPILTLGEGNTPLVPIEGVGGKLFLKLESTNPSGSYKDRLAAVLVSALDAGGVKSAVEDSSGNAGAALAAYAAVAGIKARVFVPESASGPKRDQIERYGAEVVAVPGPRQAATDAVMDEVRQGAVYASHAFLPQGLAGVATIAYELVEDLGRVPGVVMAPVGHGGLLLGIVLGFDALLDAGEIDELPKFIGVQARKNAPLWAAAKGLEFVPAPTIAEGIAVRRPARMRELLDLSSCGIVQFVVVEEEQIQHGWVALAHHGFYVEPTSAVIWDAFSQTQKELISPVVAVISGHGLKA